MSVHDEKSGNPESVRWNFEGPYLGLLHRRYLSVTRRILCGNSVFLFSFSCIDVTLRHSTDSNALSCPD